MKNFNLGKTLFGIVGAFLMTGFIAASATVEIYGAEYFGVETVL